MKRKSRKSAEKEGELNPRDVDRLAILYVRLFTIESGGLNFSGSNGTAPHLTPCGI